MSRNDEDASERKIAALGRLATLGRLYDIRTDSLLSTKIFNGTLPFGHSEGQDRGHSTTDLRLTTLKEEKFDNFNVSGNLALSVIGGIVEVNGASKALSKKRTSLNEEHYTYSNVKNTRQERVYLKDLHNLVDKTALASEFESSSATHVIIAIGYGIVTNVVFSYKSNEEEESKKRERSFGSKLKANDPVLEGIRSFLESVGLSPMLFDGGTIGGDVKMEEESSLKKVWSNLTLSIYSDEPAISAVGQDKECLKKIAEILAKPSTLNGGNGCQQNVYLLPIQEAARQLGITPPSSPTKFTIVRDPLVKELMNEIDRADKELASFHDLEAIVENKRHLFPADFVRKVSDTLDECESTYETWKLKLRGVLKKLHDFGGANQAKLFKDYYQELEPCLKKIRDFIAQPALSGRLRVLNSLTAEGVRNGLEELTALKRTKRKRSFYVLYYSINRDYNDTLIDSIDSFLAFRGKESKRRRKKELVAIDIDVFESKTMSSATGPCVHRYRKDGRIDERSLDVRNGKSFCSLRHCARLSRQEKISNDEAEEEGEGRDGHHDDRSLLEETSEDSSADDSSESKEDYEIVKETIWAPAHKKSENLQQRIAHVIHNRAKANLAKFGGNNFSDVCRKEHQFKCWEGITEIDINCDFEVYDRMEDWLPEILHGRTVDTTCGSEYFFDFDEGPPPQWTKSLGIMEKVENFQFYAPNYDLTDYETVKKTIWLLARGETEKGQVRPNSQVDSIQQYIAHVIQNRAAANLEHFGGAKLSHVCRRPFQFGCWDNVEDIDVSSDIGVYKRMDVWLPDILKGRITDPTEGCDHFLSSKEELPDW